MISLTDLPPDVIREHIMPHLERAELHVLRRSSCYLHGLIPIQGNCDMCSWAGFHGSYSLLKWAVANQYPINENACALAALQGHLDFLKILRSAGFPWDSATCAHAALGGHLAVLKWARESGCPWDSSVYICARANKHTEIIQWAHDNNCPGIFPDNLIYPRLKQ
jgi:hypothetical protein